MEKNNKIFIWSPFTSKVGTVKNVINFTSGLADYSKKSSLIFPLLTPSVNGIISKELEDKKFNFFDFFIQINF